MRRGYNAEYTAKKKLIEKYGKDSVIKVAIGGMVDYIIIQNEKVIKLVEVKKTKSKKWYPKQRDKQQFERIYRFCKDNKLKCEYWIFERSNLHVYELNKVGKLYFNKG